MGDGQRRFPEDEAFLRRLGGCATSLGAFDNGHEVQFRLKTQERQLEPAFAVLRAVAGALIAAELGESRDYVVAKADRPSGRVVARAVWAIARIAETAMVLRNIMSSPGGRAGSGFRPGRRFRRDTGSCLTMLEKPAQVKASLAISVIDLDYARQIHRLKACL